MKKDSERMSRGRPRMDNVLFVLDLAKFNTTLKSFNMIDVRNPTIGRQAVNFYTYTVESG